MIGDSSHVCICDLFLLLKVGIWSVATDWDCWEVPKRRQVTHDVWCSLQPCTSLTGRNASILCYVHTNSLLDFSVSRLMVKQSFWSGCILRFLHSTFTVTSLLVR